MIFADKLIRLRKKSGMSQEELAEKMNVSRQAVSKWEGAQSVPELEKILQLANLFGVTTDYLLKDELEDEVFTGEDSPEKTRRLSLEQANEFLGLRKKAAVRIATGVFMCIISVIPLLALGGFSEYGGLSENFAGGVGMIILLVLVAGAVGIFIHTDFQNTAYKFLDNEPFEAEYGVAGMAHEQKKAFGDTYRRSNIIGVILCILSVIALFAAAISENELWCVIGLCTMIFVVGIGVVLFVWAGTRWAAIQKLLKEGDFTDERKNRRSVIGPIAAVYWCVVVAIYLAWLFLEKEHGNSKSWVVFPVGAMIFAAIAGVVKMIEKPRKNFDK